MVAGDKWELFIPSELGYGDGGQGSDIGGGGHGDAHVHVRVCQPG